MNAPPKLPCKHLHWIIDSPSGSPTVKAHCRDCPATRYYPASHDDRVNLRAGYGKEKGNG